MDIDYFLSAFQSQFPDRHAFRRGDTVVVPGGCAEIGEIQVLDDDDEFIVSIGDFTHGHFNPYNATLTS